MANNIKVFKVKSKSKDYEVVIGNSIVSQIERKKDLLKRERFALIVSTRVNKLFGEYIENSLKSYKNYDLILMPDGEEHKNYRYAEEILNTLLKKGYTRKSVIIGIGGGVVGDFAGYVASLYMRGIPIIHIPTTLLAMVDSSIGGKVAVNISAGKNIVGAFYQPEIVISDISFLRTLPEREFKNGIVEVLKHALIGESKLLNILMRSNLESINNSNTISDVVYLSASFKSRIVEMDEQEGGIRAILNFGHTVGHAIESLMEFRGISHGEAVAIGLKIEMQISKELGWLSHNELDLVDDIMDRYKLIYNEYNIQASDTITHMMYDKKNREGKINFVLLNGIGNPVYNQSFEKAILKEILMDCNIKN